MWGGEEKEEECKGYHPPPSQTQSLITVPQIPSPFPFPYSPWQSQPNPLFVSLRSTFQVVFFCIVTPFKRGKKKKKKKASLAVGDAPHSPALPPPFHAIHEIINMQLQRSHPLGPPSSKQGSSQYMRRRRPKNVGRATDNAPRAFSLFSLISKEAHDLALKWQKRRLEGGRGEEDRGKIAILTETRRRRTPARNYYPFPMPASKRSPPSLPFSPCGH